MRTKFNEQEAFWAGEFGNEYIQRNKTSDLLRSNIHFFANILKRTNHVNSIIELGANIGMNLQALTTLLPNLKASAVEINETAVDELRKTHPTINVYHQSIVNFTSNERYDLSFVKGVLIHINPDDLAKVYDVLYTVSKRYILIAEYYNPKPTVIDYRGHQNKLFKRDFCGEMLDRFSDLALVDYQFCYHRDNYFPQDDITWFLLEKIR